ncbi:MAG: sigma-54 dependent transcriptional regulator [Candidatus Cloacimonetes bacterium]|nr:sigma-54 dependent transcriptional regulator [Candidatus Cloacimonadota bacterium]
MKKLTILVIDDEKGYRDEISEYLTDNNFDVLSAERPSEALEIVSSKPIDIAIIDLKLPEMSGIELLKKIIKIDNEIATIMISGHGDMDTAIAAMREGAIDFFSKPFNLSDIEIAIQRTQKFINMQKKVSIYRHSFKSMLCSDDEKYLMLAHSSKMKEILKLINKVAVSNNTDVLITGESGTGKELVARGIHRLSENSDEIFFDVNCTAISPSLFESEFFGHSKNAFTGADSNKKGYFENADNGTLFLDEIGDMPISMQAKLLRVLELRKIRRVGSLQDINLNLRIIASTNKNLEKMVQNNTFRKDLFYRLNKFHINIPVLKERLEDIIPLAEHFNEKFSLSLKKQTKPISDSSKDKLLKYSYPGNIRELKNIIEKAVIMDRIEDEFLQIDSSLVNKASSASINSIFKNFDDLSLSQLDNLEKQMITVAMQKTDNNKTKAAKLLKITRTGLNRRIKKYDLEF